MTTTAAPDFKLLNLHQAGWGALINGRAFWVEDQGDSYVLRADRGGQVYRVPVWPRGLGKCNCAAGEAGQDCLHRQAVIQVRDKW